MLPNPIATGVPFFKSAGYNCSAGFAAILMGVHCVAVMVYHLSVKAGHIIYQHLLMLVLITYALLTKDYNIDTFQGFNLL